MISPDTVAEQLLTLLKANGALTAALGAADQIKESQWHGIAFTYPAVRVQRCILTPYGNGNCTTRQSRAQVTITAYSKKDSSKTVQQLQGLIEDALEGKIINAAGIRSIAIRSQQTSPAAPTTDDPDVWAGATTWRTIVTEVT